MNRTYEEIKKLSSFIERYYYLKLSSRVGQETFGYDRYLNQILYKSKRWRSIRDIVIVRDDGCDLGIAGYEINDQILIHHMNPISIDDINNENNAIFDPEFLICTSYNTHQAIHYGDESFLPLPPINRRPNDTIPWR